VIYTPAGPSFVQAVFSADGYVPHDGSLAILGLLPGAASIDWASAWFQWQPGRPDAASVAIDGQFPFMHTGPLVLAPAGPGGPPTVGQIHLWLLVAAA
jgi:hypothetical protein